ncbi:MAG: DNA polymerase IV [Candidatus Faecimonas sp.]|nr:DNA polymerase IV [Mycoplasmatota bacterium]MDY2908418.1 DNA polymerase IV [Candidatus Faecimonas sp.]
MKERIIFHVDVNNAFLSWTAVLLLKKGYPIDIREIPSIIGGSETERRGIVLAKSPVAKRFGIKTAETIYQAKRKCPNLKVFPPNYHWYYEQSTKLFEYLSQYSPVLEKFSIDECFIDMTGTNYLYKDYYQLAIKIKEEIKEKFGFTVNVGIGNNKLCAKMASDFEKPDKVHTLLKEEVEEKLWPLNVGDLFMVGKRTTEELNKLNIFTIKDLAMASDKILERQFKNQARYLKEAAWGIDNTKVEPRSSKTTSISTTETLTHDYTDEEKLKDILFRQTEDVTRELRKQKQYAKTVAVIYKNNSFRNYSAQSKLPYPTNSTKEIYKLVIEIFNKSYKKDPIRLIGVRLADLQETKERQLTLFEENTIEEDQEEEIQKTIDDINQKFGKSIVAPASLKIIGNPKSKRNMKN